MAGERFDELPEVYEAMIDWGKRLAYEEPFYRGVFERVGARSVLDVACGTGRHAAMFHSWGLAVEGADVSQGMIGKAVERFGQPDGLRWVVRGFDRPVDRPGSFDVAVCVGNSLSLASDEPTMAQGLARMAEAVRVGGAVVVHVLNVWRLQEGQVVWQKCQRAVVGGRKVIIVKGVHRCGATGFVDLVVIGEEGELGMKTDCVPFRGVEASWVERVLREAGVREVEVYGGYRGEPYERERSGDLVVVGVR